MATPNYEIDYNDKRFTDVKTEEKNAINSNNTFYNKAVDKIDNQINTQIGNVKDWGAQQAKNQQAMTDQAVKEINQKKEWARQDYNKEQSAAYTDWQKQSNQYGANAEQMAASGLANTGYSESSQVAMYNQYQNRVAVAREAIVRAETEFDNQIAQAKLQNSSILAEIAFNTLKEIDTLTLSGIQQTTALRSEQANRELTIKNMYHTQWQDVLKQINTENSLAESVRQYNETMAFNKQKEANDKAYRDAAMALDREKFEWQKAEAAKSSLGGGGSINKGSSSSGHESTNKKVIGGTIDKGSAHKETGEKNNSGTIDMNSVLKLGYGPISASRLSELVSQGAVEQYKEGGKIKFRRVYKAKGFTGRLR